MNIVPTQQPVTLYHGDCIEVMASLPADSVDAIVTSPPYAEQRKSTYGGIPEKDYPAWTVAWMAEAKRLLKPDGSVIINIRPHVRKGQISDYVLRTRLALRDAGWAEIEELIWDKVGAPPMGSNQRPRRSWESLLWYAKHGRPYSNPKAAGVETNQLGISGLRNFPHNGKQTKDSNTFSHKGVARVPDIVRVSTINNRWDSPPPAGKHPAPYPPGVAEWCGKLICPVGGVVMDPFSGSGSTGVAAIRNGWYYIGIDSVYEYVEMSRARLEAEEAA